jgi:site-specific recombinase XerD
MKKLEILKISFILRSDKKTSGSSPVMMQLYLSGRRAYLGTGYKASFDEWDFIIGKFKSTTKKFQSLNEMLDRIKMDAINIYNLMRSSNDDVTVSELRDRLSGKDAQEEVREKTLLAICDQYNKSFEQLVGKELNKDTFRRYLAARTKLGEFIQLNLKTNDIELSKIKYSFGIEFEHYLKTNENLHQNTVVKYMQYLNRVLDYSVKYEYLDKNILSGYKCPIKESKREYLTQAELDKIIEKEIKIQRLNEVRDCFVFCCFTGYAYKDAALLTPGHIATGINGRKWIYTSRQKTENVSNVPLLDKASEIIEKYKDHPLCVNKNRLLPMKSNQKLNAYLKELADICGITKPMTMHIARHTFATTVLLSNGVSMEATSKMLGHSSIKTTQIYGKVLETRVGSEMEMLSEKLSKKKDNSLREAQ